MGDPRGHQPAVGRCRPCVSLSATPRRRGSSARGSAAPARAHESPDRPQSGIRLRRWAAWRQRARSGPSRRRRQAMADIFTGRLGGTPRKQFPRVFKAAELQGVEALDIEIHHNPGARLVQGGRRGRGPRARTCARPGDGHVRNPGAPPPGARTLRPLDRRQRRPLVFSVQGRCAYETTFEYSSDDR
jgi:hypothetical protein